VKKILTLLLLISTLALCGLVVAQWLREAEYRAEIDHLITDLQAENKLRVATEEKAAAYEVEIARITQLRADTEAKLLEVTDEFVLTRTDQLQRGLSIVILSNELAQTRTKADAADKRLSETTAAVADRNTSVTEQNTAIATANERLKQLASERDKAIDELNARTKAYNELVLKYNKLAK